VTPIRIGPYEVLRAIGRGATAIVYEALDPRVRRRVALKVINDRDVDRRLIERLHHEASAAARLRHPNIVAVHEMGTSGEWHYIAMDYVDGVTLDRAVVTMPVRQRMEALERIARAAGYAHGQGVVHRDLKPQNVLVESGTGRLYLSDFGLAKSDDLGTLTRTGAVLGTPYYMSPEQVLGHTKHCGPETDVWALGVMICELASGRMPFEGSTPVAIYERIVGGEPQVRLSDAGLRAVCAKALQRDPAQRYRDAAALADDLRRWLRGERVLAEGRSLLVHWMRRRLRAVIAFASLAAAASLIVMLAVRQGYAARDSSRDAARRDQNVRELSFLESVIIERSRDQRRGRIPAVVARRDIQEVLKQVDVRIGASPGDARGYLVRARARLALGDFKAAVEEARRGTRVDPNSRAAWSLLAVALIHDYQRNLTRLRWGLSRPYEETGQIEEVVRAFERGGGDWQNNVSGRLLQALYLYYGRNHGASAVDLLLKDAETLCSDEHAYWLGTWASKTEDKERWLRRAIEWSPGFTEAYELLGEILMQSDRSAEAESLMCDALARDTGCADAFLVRAGARWALGRRQEAMEDIDRAIEVSETPAHVYGARGQRHYEMGNLAGALADMDRAVQLDASLIEARYVRGRLRAESGQWDAAIDDMDAVLRQDGGFNRARVARAKALRGRGRPDDHREARAELDRAIACEPGLAVAWSESGLLRAAEGDRAGAEADYERSIERGGCVQAYVARGILRHERGDLRNAIADYDRAINIYPYVHATYFNRGLAWFHLNDLKRAAQDFTRTIELDPSNADAYVQRARVRVSQGDRSGGRADLEAALRAAPPGWPSRATVEETLRTLE